MAKDPLAQVRLNQKRFALQQLTTTKQRLNDDLYKAILLQRFAFAYADEYEISHDQAKAQAAGEAKLPKDNPDTSRNEEVTYKNLEDIVRKIYKDKATSISEITDEAGQIEGDNRSIRALAKPASGDPNSLALKILQILGQQSSVDSEVTDAQNDIRDLTEQSKTT